MAVMTSTQQARAMLMVQHPFFATIVASTPTKIDRTIPYAATDAKYIYINPDTCDTVSADIMKTILAHEALHIMLDHVPRMIQHQYNRLEWNYATDYAINLTLSACGFTPFEGWLHETQYQGMSADAIYAQRQQRAASKPKPQQGQGQGQGDTTLPSSPSNGMLGADMREPEDAGDPTAMAQMQRSIQQRVTQAASVARMAGKFPAELERLVTAILDPVVPWPDLLRDYMTRTTQDDESWSRRNRRFGDVYLPTRYTERMGEIVFIGDTSGSITSTELAQGVAEVHSVADMMHPERIRLVWADTKVAGEQVFEPNDPIDCIPQGGGGTDMRVPLEYVAQYAPQVVVLMTDGYTPWPTDEPPYPLIVLCTTDAPCPIGQVIRV